jgi:16S rRNA (adenine1518-N6/adenine1519-N6)-dimethyltransferase
MDAATETLARRTRRLLAEMGHRPRKALGQSFLIDPSVAQRIADIVCEGQRPRVLEIGAGLGALTEPLAACSSALVSVEIDPALASAVESLLADQPHVRVLVDDILHADLGALCEGDPSAWRVAGNLPYASATAIVLRLLEQRPPFERVAVMVQREVGERLMAAPGRSDYGSLAVALGYHCESVKPVLRVPRGAFQPQPRVDSTVLALKPRRNPLVTLDVEACLFPLVRAGFEQRRKKLANALANRLEGLDRGSAEALLQAASIRLEARAQELSLRDFLRLAEVAADVGVKPDGPP